MGLVKCGRRVLGVRDTGAVLLRSAAGEPYYWLDGLAIRQAMLFQDGGRYLLYYDAMGPELNALSLMLAKSDDLRAWEKLGPVVAPSCAEYPSADHRQHSDYLFSGSPWIYEENGSYRMYMTACTGKRGLFAPLPYYTTLAKGPSMAGPWRKETALPGKSKRICIPLIPGTYFSDTACAGSVIQNPAWRGEGDAENKKYMMFFSAASYRGLDPRHPMSLARGVGIARTDDLDATDDYDKQAGNFWQPDPDPIIPLEDDVENATAFYDTGEGMWYLFVNHIHESNQYTDAIWVYWSRDANRWNPEDKAEVLSGKTCAWTHGAVGMPTVARISPHRLAMVYDATADGSTSHFGRDIALAYIDLPIRTT